MAACIKCPTRVCPFRNVHPILASPKEASPKRHCMSCRLRSWDFERKYANPSNSTQVPQPPLKASHPVELPKKSLFENIFSSRLKPPDLSKNLTDEDFRKS
jgi:hypothetical protein